MHKPQAPQFKINTEKDFTNSDIVLHSNITLLPESNKSCFLKDSSDQLSPLAKELVEECYKDKLSLFETTITINRLCQNIYSLEQVGKYMRRLRNQEAKNKLSTTLKKRTTNLPYVTNYLPIQRNQLKKNPKEKTTNKQELVKASGVFF